MSDNHPSVPTNKLQSRLHANELRALRPGSGEVHYDRCKIIAIYRANAIEKVAANLGKDPNSDIPDDIKLLIMAHPGVIFAKVLRERRNTIHYLPFEKTIDELHSIYGNDVQLRDQDAKIKFMNTDVNAGRIVIVTKTDTAVLDVEEETKAYSIGAIFAF